MVLRDLRADVRYGLRMMRKSRGFTLVAVLTLALGIGANSAMFAILYGILYRPLPFADESRTAMVHMNFSPQNNPRGNLCVADFLDWRNGNTAFSQVAAYSRSRFTLTGEVQAEQVAGATVTGDFFSILGLHPILGSTFQPGDDAATGPNLVVISASLWHRRFGGERDVIGRVIEVNGEPATIVGVLQSSYDFPLRNTELWQIMHLQATRRGPFFLQGIARLAPGKTLESAQAETNVIAQNIERANPGTYSRLTMPVESLRDYLTGNVRPALFVMFAAVLAVLLIATVNIANLLLARGRTREREMAVRLSLGAGRRRLVQQLLTESVLLSLLGAGAGLSLAFAGIRLFRTFHPADLPLAQQVRLDWSVLLFTVTISVGVGVLFGLVPATQTMRGDLQALRDGGRGAFAATRRRHLGGVLVVAEIALSLVLLVTAGLLLRSFMLHKADAGFNVPPENPLTMVVTPKAPGKTVSRAIYENWMISFYQRLTDNVGRLPGVQYAAISDSIPPDQESDDDTFQHRRAPVDAAGISQHHISEDQPRVLPRARRSPATRAVFYATRYGHISTGYAYQ